MDTNQSNKNLSWFQQLRSLPKRYQLKFSYMLKNAAGISKFLVFYGIWAILSYVYVLLFNQETTINEFLQPVSIKFLDPVKKYSLLLFYSLHSLNLLHVGFLTLGFWYLFRFIKSLDPDNPFNNPLSKNYIAKVAWFIQGFCLVKIIYPFVFLRVPKNIITAGTAFIPNDPLLINYPGHFYIFIYFILMFFTALFARLFRKCIDMNNELEEVI